MTPFPLVEAQPNLVVSLSKQYHTSQASKSVTVGKYVSDAFLNAPQCSDNLFVSIAFTRMSNLLLTTAVPASEDEHL